MIGATLTEWALLLTAVGGFVAIATTSAVQIITVLRMHKDVKQVKHELETLNGQTVGQATDATESRRIKDIPEAERTPAEVEHLAVVPPPDPSA